MKKLFTIITLVAAVFFMASCTDNARAKSWGGTIDIELPAGKKLVTAMFDDEGDLWYLTSDMENDYVPQTKMMQEYSRLGVFEGTIYFKESR